MQTVHQIPALLQRITTAIESNPHVRSRKVRIDADNDRVVVLEGHVDSFFQKQMAQEAIRRVDGVSRIENRLTVNWA
jgi:osmotically-inducible protein OsmY